MFGWQSFSDPPKTDGSELGPFIPKGSFAQDDSFIRMQALELASAHCPNWAVDDLIREAEKIYGFLAGPRSDEKA